MIALESSGFHIVRRLRPAPRPALAASVITIGYVDSPLSRLRPNATRSRVEAERLAQRIVRRLARHPDQFEALRAEHCDQVMCDAVTSWTQGRHLFALEAAVARLRVGEVGTQPVDSPLGLLILRREDAAAHPPPPEPTPTFAFPGGFAQGWDAESASGS